MNKLVLYHSSPGIITKPVFDKGNPKYVSSLSGTELVMGIVANVMGCRAEDLLEHSTAKDDESI